MALADPKTPKRRSAISESVAASFTPAQRVKTEPVEYGTVVTKRQPASNAGHQSGHKSSAMSNYALGDCLGKGAFASVYRAINTITGETVAVKQVQVDSLSAEAIQSAMSEIDLLKNLRHPNIVKYHGFAKTSSLLSIVLEYCENGSLSSICKRFGKFPESLVQNYMRQTLTGLAYLHEQGVIHRDIKGGNILTTKDGIAKLADFGVATTHQSVLASKLEDPSFVDIAGTPYYMAPEVVEMSGEVTTASDIWSVGCTAIELLTGKPPYSNMTPEAAIYAIGHDEYPPIPDHLTASCKDFLVECFQRNPHLRASASKLLKHSWITGGIQEVAKFDDALQKVKRWNDSSKTAPVSPKVATHSAPYSPSPARIQRKKLSEYADDVASSDLGWDDAFSDGEADKIANKARIGKSSTNTINSVGSDGWKSDDPNGASSKSSGSSQKCPDIDKYRETSLEGVETSLEKLVGDLDISKAGNCHKKPSTSTAVANQQIRALSEYEDSPNDDMSEFIIDPERILVRKLPVEDPFVEESDPFAQIDEEELRNNIQEEEAYADNEVSTEMEAFISAFNTAQLSVEDMDGLSSRFLWNIVNYPDSRKIVFRLHGLIPLLELLKAPGNTHTTILNIMKSVNILLKDNQQVLENWCLLGGIPVITRYSMSTYSDELQFQTAEFVHYVTDEGNRSCLQMFISCGGLKILTEYIADRMELAEIGIQGVWSVFQLEGSFKNDICRLLSKGNILQSLAIILPDIDDDRLLSKSMDIFTYFSQTESYVAKQIADEAVLYRLFSILRVFSDENCVIIVKFVKSLSMVRENFMMLQHANTIPVLLDLLVARFKSEQYKDFLAPALHTLFNLCRLDRKRIETAALYGLVPILQRVIEDDSPLKQFATPLLCDMPGGKVGRKKLWVHNGLITFLRVVREDPSWHIKALDAIGVWMTQETAKIELELLKPKYMEMLMVGLEEVKANNYNVVIDTFHRLLKSSIKLCRGVPSHRMNRLIRRRLKTSVTNVMIQTSLLKLLKTLIVSRPVYDIDDSLASILRALSRTEIVIVKQLARDCRKEIKQRTPERIAER